MSSFAIIAEGVTDQTVLENILQGYFHTEDDSAMDPEFCTRNAGRIVFAIAVDSIECWLLPLLYDGEAAKKAKITGCLEAANWKLRRLNRPPLSTADSKNLASYERASRDYAKHRKLMGHRGENPSLDVFVENLAALGDGSAGGDGSGPEPKL